MAAECFLDTNVLIYAFAAGDRRSLRATELLADGGVIGIQVLNEFTSVARRKLIWQWDDIEAALAVVEELLGAPRPLTSAIHARALMLAREHALSFYDALIVAAACDAGCRVLLSENFQHGRAFGPVRIQNPFAN
jgi:predicted nucleic acid-binding protein